MPISDDEWDAGTTRSDADPAETTPVGEYETEKDLIVAFLSTNGDNAYTRTEIVRGVDFGDATDPKTVGEALVSVPQELVDFVGDVVASGLVVDDVDEALTELVEDGTVVEKDVATDAGTTAYYRLNTLDAQE